MYHRKPSINFTGKCTVTYELASDVAKAVNIFNEKKMFEGGRLTVEMAMVPLHIHAIEASRSRAGPSGSHQTTSKRQQAHWDPPHPHRLPPHLLAKCKENKCDLCLVSFHAFNSQSHYIGRRHRLRVEEILGTCSTHLDPCQPGFSARRDRAFHPY